MEADGDLEKKALVTRARKAFKLGQRERDSGGLSESAGSVMNLKH